MSESFDQTLLPDPGNDVLLSILNKLLVWGLALGPYIIFNFISVSIIEIFVFSVI